MPDDPTEETSEKDKLADQNLTAFDEPSEQSEELVNTSLIDGAEAFDSNALNRFLLEKSGRTIAIIGEFQSGKTTLSTSIYGFLKDGPFGVLEFAGSRTLIGLEKRLHDSTIESGRSIPDTERTSIQSGLQYLHLELVDSSSGKRRDIFFSDRAGETFTQLRAGEISPNDIEEIKHASFLLILLDGEKVASTRHRTNALENVRQLLRILVEDNSLSPSTIIHVTTTKLDTILEKDNSENILTHLTSFENELNEQFGNSLFILKFVRLAARTSSNSNIGKENLSQLASMWVSFEPELAERKKPNLVMANEFERLMVRS